MAEKTASERLARMIATGEDLGRIARTRYSRWGALVCWIKGSHPIPNPPRGYGRKRCRRCGKELSGIFASHTEERG
jgi:hypothetical protein